ncbi:MAG: amino acid permease [Cyclonatronaceae bacterium]
MNPDSSSAADSRRTLGLVGATGIGVGAMVGGGILALAGVAFSVTGPSAILAFLLNGIIAFITALSFAEMAAANPQSGGTYTYAKKALTLKVAFGVGWVVWFASLVAAVLYALGFAAFAIFALEQLWPGNTAWLSRGATPVVLALAALGFYAFKLSRSSGGGGDLANIGKLAVFAILIATGLAAAVQTPFAELRNSVQPFFSDGFTGLIAAMGYTFIALQGFDLIGSAAGEIKEPEKNIPRAMMATLIVGLIVYLPLLFVVMTVGIPAGESVAEVSAANPETIVAIAAQNYLGAFGFWLVLTAGIFSMLSALQANIFAASRIALAMANDRTLSHHLSYINPQRGTPVTAVLVTASLAAVLVLLLPDVAAAGAASSLIFLITFALGHLINILMRRRRFGDSKTFRVPFFPALPLIGMAACVGLGLFQAVAEPAAGVITLIWLLIGTGLFLAFFISKARVMDAAEQALNPDLVRLRGLSPLVLLPISNPANAQSMVFVANALAPPVVGRVMLLSIVIPPDETSPSLVQKQLQGRQNALQQALMASISEQMKPDALTTIAREPWGEIARVAEEHNCRSILLGLSSLSESQTTENLEKLIHQVRCDVAIFRQPSVGWNITRARRILIPVAGFSDHDALRARIAGSLWRASQPEMHFVQIVPEETDAATFQRNEKALKRFSTRIIPGSTTAEVLRHNDPKAALLEQARAHDLVIIGLGKTKDGRRIFGDLSLSLARQTSTGLIFISHVS